MGTYLILIQEKLSDKKLKKKGKTALENQK